MTWKLVGQENAYEHFGLPFLLSTTRLYRRIRNIQLRLLPPGQLMPQEVSKYDEQSVMEALHNCIAHQDYCRGARILVTEYPDRLVFDNSGSFLKDIQMTISWEISLLIVTVTHFWSGPWVSYT